MAGEIEQLDYEGILRLRKDLMDVYLSITDFTYHFDAKRLGRLYFPNGKAYVHPGGCGFDHSAIINFYVDLNDLYKMVCDWKVNHTLISPEDIIAIIAFGSAVRYPDAQEVTILRRKYWLFGKRIEKTKRVPIQPRDADFLVITERDIMREEVLEPISLHTYDCGTWIEKGGIHLVNRGVNQFLKGIQSNDTVSISSLREGVPVFFNHRFEDIVKEAAISSSTPRRIIWGENNQGVLTGWIR